MFAHIVEISNIGVILLKESATIQYYTDGAS